MSRHFVVIKVQTKQEKKNYQEKMSHLTKFIVCCSDKTYTSVSAQTHEKGIYLFISDHIKNKRHARKHVLFSHLLCFFVLTLCSLYTIVKFSKNKKTFEQHQLRRHFSLIPIYYIDLIKVMRIHIATEADSNQSYNEMNMTCWCCSTKKNVRYEF